MFLSYLSDSIFSYKKNILLIKCTAILAIKDDTATQCVGKGLKGLQFHGWVKMGFIHIRVSLLIEWEFVPVFSTV